MMLLCASSKFCVFASCSVPSRSRLQQRIMMI